MKQINGNADVRAMNLRSQARYRKWAYGFSPSVYGQEIYKDTAIYYSDPETGEPRGNRRIPAPGAGRGGGRAMNQYPQVTFNVGMTEAPDETAQGEWLNLVSRAGFSFLLAHVNYLRDGDYKLERIEEAGQRDAVSLTVLRVRPVKPGKGPRVATTPTSTDRNQPPLTVAPVTEGSRGMFQWWHDADREAKRALAAGMFGWMLDAFDVMLFALVLPVGPRRPGTHERAGRATWAR